MTPTQPRRLSSRQEQILVYIKTSLVERGFPPSIREIGLQVDLSSSSTVHSHLKTIENKGYIKRDPSKPRSIQLLDAPPGRENPVVTYHKSVVDFVCGMRDDAAYIESAETPVHEFTSLEEIQIGKIQAGAEVAACEKILQHLRDTSPLGGLQ